jgi:hypothetical protein
MGIQIVFTGTPSQVRSEMAELLGLPKGPFAVVPVPQQPPAEPAQSSEAGAADGTASVAQADSSPGTGAEAPASETPKRGRGRPPKAKETPSSEGAEGPQQGNAGAVAPAAPASGAGDGTSPAAPSETPADRPLTPDDVRAALSEFFSKFGDAPARKVFREYDAFKPGTNTSDENGKARKISELKPEDYGHIIARFRGLIANGLPEGF